MKKLAHDLLKAYIRSFSISKGKNRILSLLWKPLSFGQFQRQTTLRQANIKMNCDLSKDLQRHIYFYGDYEEEICQQWLNLAGEATTIFDVGANVGIYSLLAAGKNSHATIHAFEPTPELLDTFNSNLRLNKFTNVVVNSVAVGQNRGQAFLHRCAGGNNSNEGMNFVSEIAEDNSDVATEVISLDDYCREEGISRIDLMKMDIEGGEYKALLGLQNLLKEKAIGCLFMELAEWAAARSGNSTADIKRFLMDAGYQIYTMNADKLVPTSMQETHEGDNIIAFAHQPSALKQSVSEVV